MPNTLYDVLAEQTLKAADSEIKEDSGRRAKERSIGGILEKVALWRRLFSGLKIQGNRTEMNLEASAKQVGLSKKTLDDYLMQIRFFS